METEKNVSNFETIHGTLRVIKTIAVFRESMTGRREIVRKERRTIAFVPDGPWLTDAMIAELDAWTSTNFCGSAPAWIVQPNAGNNRHEP
jgi:hypothetical protein